MEINTEFLEKAERIIKERKEKIDKETDKDKKIEEYIEKCIQANICPSCSEGLKIHEGGDEGGWYANYSCKCGFDKSYDGGYE